MIDFSNSHDGLHDGLLLLRPFWDYYLLWIYHVNDGQKLKNWTLKFPQYCFVFIFLFDFTTAGAQGGGGNTNPKKIKLNQKQFKSLSCHYS